MTAPGTGPRRLSRAGLGIRLGLAGAVLLALLHGTVVGADQDFPFGPMVQYAFYVDPDGEIDDTYLEADTTAGTRVRVPLTVDSVGVNRAQVEGHLDQIRRDPAELASLAQAHRRRHPGDPGFTRLYLRQHVTDLHDASISSRYERTVAEWAP